MAHGMPEAGVYFEQLLSSRSRSPLSRMPIIDQPLVEAEIENAGDWQFEVIETDGHATAHHSFFSREPALLISGDQVLPSHGRPFRGLRTRTADLRSHHHEHLVRRQEALRRTAPDGAYRYCRT